MFFAAVYLRTKNIWVVILVHAALDFAGLISSGIYQQSASITDIISSYSLTNLVVVVVYIVMTIFITRRSKMKIILANYGIDEAEHKDQYRWNHMISSSKSRNPR